MTGERPDAPRKRATAKKAAAKKTTMKADGGDPLYQAATDALEKAREAMEDRTHAIDNLAEEVSISNEKLDEIDDRLGRFALRSDVARRRRVSTIRLAYLILWSFVLLIGLVSYKVERCSPGARAHRVFGALLIDGVDLEGIRDVIREPVSPVCDIAFPLYSHEVGTDWPTSGNALGSALYAGLLVAGGVASRRRPWENLDLADTKTEERTIP